MLGEWAEFYREFLQVSRYLLNQHKLSTNEQNRGCMKALTDATRSKVLHRLSIVNPNIHPDDGYPMADIDSAARFVLHGTSGDPPRPADLTPG
jgi:hypothetical protein